MGSVEGQTEGLRADAAVLKDALKMSRWNESRVERCLG